MLRNNIYLLSPRLTLCCHIFLTLVSVEGRTRQHQHQLLASCARSRPKATVVCFWASKSLSSTSHPQIVFQKQSLQIYWDGAAKEHSWKCGSPLRRFHGIISCNYFMHSRQAAAHVGLHFHICPIPQSQLSLTKDSVTFPETLSIFSLSLPAGGPDHLTERNTGTNLIALTFVTFAEAGTHGLRMDG